MYKPTKEEMSRLRPFARRYVRVRKAMGFTREEIGREAPLTHAAAALPDWPLFNNLMYGNPHGNPDELFAGITL